MRLRSAAALLFCAALAGAGTVSLWIPLLMYRPAALARPDPARWGVAGARAVEIRADDGTRLAAWWKAPPGTAATTVLILHGRSANVSTRAGAMRRLAGDGFGVLMIDWRGYGASDGRPSEAGLRSDARGAYAWLRAQGVAPARLVVIGQSLGNAAAARLAAERPVAALVLVSPFTRLPDALGARLPWLPARWLPWRRNRFEVAGYVARLDVPVGLVASASDGMVPLSESAKVAAAARDPRWLRADDLRHDGLLAGVAERGALTALLRALAPQPAEARLQPV